MRPPPRCPGGGPICSSSQVTAYLRRGGCRTPELVPLPLHHRSSFPSPPRLAARQPATPSPRRACPAASENDTPSLSLACSPRLCPNRRPCQCLWRWFGGLRRAVRQLRSFGMGIADTPVASSFIVWIADGGIGVGVNGASRATIFSIGSSDPVLFVLVRHPLGGTLSPGWSCSASS